MCSIRLYRGTQLLQRIIIYLFIYLFQQSGHVDMWACYEMKVSPAVFDLETS
jgi:hypothetical protein